MASMEFPSNSREPKPAPKIEKPEKKPILKVVDGEVIRRKKPLGAKFREMFFGQETRNQVVSVVQDVLLPAGRDMIYDTLSEALKRAVLGGSSRSGRDIIGSRIDSMVGRVSYNQYSTSSRRRDDDRPVGMSRRGRATHDFDEIILGSFAEAETVIHEMYDLLAKYDSVSVADLYELVDIDGTHADELWGWTDLRGARARRISSGYLLELPRTMPLRIR